MLKKHLKLKRQETSDRTGDETRVGANNEGFDEDLLAEVMEDENLLQIIQKV